MTLAKIIVALMLQLGFPHHTKLFIADEPTWTKLTTEAEVRYKTTTAFTIFKLPKYKVDQVVVRKTYAEDSLAKHDGRLEFTLAHELGHIRCYVCKEETVDRMAWDILWETDQDAARILEKGKL